MLKKITKYYSQSLQLMIHSDNYQFLKISGSDTIKMLNNIVTTNVDHFMQKEELVSLPCFLLEAKGKIISDFTINKPQKLVNKKPQNCKDELWLKIPEANFEVLKKHLMVYKLGKKVHIENITQLMDHVYILNNSSIPNFNIGKRFEEFYKNTLNGENLIGEGMFDFACVDPRSPQLGSYLISIKENQITQYFQNNKPEILSKGRQIDYDINRYLRYVFEGSDIVDTYPLTVNGDFYNSIEFNKGCYVGQELSARQNFTTIVTKRMTPFVVTDSPILNYESAKESNIHLLKEHINKNFQYNLSKTIFYDENKMKKLVIIKNIANVALGMLKYESIGPMVFEKDGLYYHRVVYEPFEKYLVEKLNLNNQ